MRPNQDDFNPGDGILFRNPTRKEITDKAKSQQEIVRNVTGPQRKVAQLTWEYKDMDPDNPKPMAGILEIKKMGPEEVEGYCKNLMRCRPNITKLHILLGDYENKKPYFGREVDALNTEDRSFPTEIGTRLADLLNLQYENVVEIIYTINEASESLFNSSGQVFVVDKEEWEDEEKFNPGIGLNYIEIN